ncbi:MAG TPA: DUF1553 domain-containing protein, partial [Pirellulaceae bacterium]|nr:DUF1553 domain-containing protein [Pirellulaceae bacterium]
HRTPRRLSAELLLDAVNAVTESSEKFDGVPPGTRAIALPDPTIVSYFLTTFGRPLRNSPCECARGSSPDLSQTLHMVNSQAMHQKVVNEQGRIARLLKSNRSDDEIAGELYLAAFSRQPTDVERNELKQLLADSAPPDRAATWQDILWALLNSAEFSYR